MLLGCSNKRTVVELGPGQSFSLTLSESQRRTLTFELLAGSVGLVTTWQGRCNRTPWRRIRTWRSPRTRAAMVTLQIERGRWRCAA